MKNTRLILGLAVVGLLTLTMAAPVSYAGHGKWGCKKCGHDKGLDDKLYHKAHMLLENADEVGLSEDQQKQIKSIKHETKKRMITKKAEINVVKLDIKHHLYERTIDTDAVNKLVSQKYALKEEKAMTLVEAMANLKNVLSDDQYMKLKELYKHKKHRK